MADGRFDTHRRRDHDDSMIRAFALATFMLAASNAVLVQAPVILHIRVTVLDGERGSVPVARHVLLISDIPVTTAPHRAVTSIQGTADVNLAPGRYIVESDRPAAVGGRSYEWTQTVDLVAGRETTLALTASNANVGTATPEMVTATAVTATRSNPTTLLSAWQQSVVALWTPRAYASGFLVDAKGLVATSHRAIGDATAIEVQVSATVKVAATVLAADAARDVAILRIDPSTVAGVRPVLLACDPAPASRALDDSELLTVEVRLRRPTDVISVPSSETAGGPVFAPDGVAIGLTSPSLEAGDGIRHGETRVIGADAVCKALAAAASKLPGSTPPSAARLPVESGQPLPAEALKAAVGGRAFTASPYRITSSDFDIVFITPLLRVAAEAQQDRMVGQEDAGLRALVDFGTWSDYVSGAPPLLLVRVTPRVVENMWMKVARGAASTQGMALPPVKRTRPGFSAMKALCDGRTITPIHPFTIQRRLSETDGIDEGLYVFDPAAIGPQCGKVSLVLSSVKEPARTETRVVDPAVVKRIAQDFATLSSPK
jgi:hypothetical protein